MADRSPQIYGLIAISLAFCILTAGRAQQPAPPTLDDVLARLESNLQTYESTVPSFFCEEHVVSQAVPSVGNHDTVTEAIFRLKRTTNADRSITLDESRDIKTVNGKPTKANDFEGPVVLQGAFSGGLAIVSLDQKACMRYSLKPIKPNRVGAPYIVQFESLFDSSHPTDCLLREAGRGQVVIDPQTMQITHMELIAPHHVMPGTSSGINSQPVVAKWTVSVDYAPVPLGGRTFWLPSTIESIATNGYLPGAVPQVWSFKARYRNYHKLEVVSRILPPDDSSPQ